MPAQKLPYQTSRTELLFEPSSQSIVPIDIEKLAPHPLLKTLYGQDPSDNLASSLKAIGQISPLLVEKLDQGFQVLSGNRRLIAARELGWKSLQAIVCKPSDDHQRQWWILESNHQRSKTFSQKMREADLMELLVKEEARTRSLANLSVGPKLRVFDGSECLNSDTPNEVDVDRLTDQSSTQTSQPSKKSFPRRSDTQIAKAIGLGGKDLYRQARTVWKAAQADDARALSSVKELDAGGKTVFAAFKDLRRRDHLATDFKPTPYDVWLFKHDRAYGTRYPGSIPAGIVANTLHYFTEPGDLVVDPMAGGGTTLDVAASLNRRCLGFDLSPSRPEINLWNIAREPLPESANGCDLIFLDPPYHSMLRSSYAEGSVSDHNQNDWKLVFERIFDHTKTALRPGGCLAVLIANQTEKDIPDGWGYVDHAFDLLQILIKQGFLPQRRITCPMEGTYRPDQIQKSRLNKRLLGQVRDLIVVRKPVG